MDVGLALPHYDHSVPGERPLRWPTVVTWAQAAEGAGFGSLWLSDHLFLSLTHWGGPDEMQESVEPLTALAALARVTTKARLGTLVLCAHLRPPGVLAKALATVDGLSAGRLTIGLGAGWFEPEYAAASLDFPPPKERLERLEETVEVLRLAFRGQPFDYAGRHVRMEQMVSLPTPVQQPGPPIWVGGSGDRLLAVAGRVADGWNAGGWRGTMAAWRERAAVLDRACEAAGRDPASVTRSVNRLALVGEDEADLRRRWDALRAHTPPGVLDGMSLDDYRHGRLVGTVAQVAEQMAEWKEAGVSSLLLSLGALPFTVTSLDAVELTASASREH